MAEEKGELPFALYLFLEQWERGVQLASWAGDLCRARARHSQGPILGLTLCC